MNAPFSLDDTLASGFRVSRDEAVARITLARPEKRNAMAPAFWRDFPRAVQALSDEGETRVLIIDAEGPVFTAGMDVSVFFDPSQLGTDTASKREAFMRSALALQETFSALERARMPVIAAVDGPCIGAGVDMITACDLRYATAESYFVVEETNIGLFADVGTLQRLPKLIPDGIARELAFTGDRLEPERALSLGLLSAVLPDRTALDSHVETVARKIAAKAPLTIAGTKRSILHARDHAVAESLQHAMMLQASLWSPSDIEEAFKAKQEKRDGDFAALAPIRRMGEG